MGIIKDWKDNNGSYTLRYKLFKLVSIKEWCRLARWRRQRADRGWSDQDTWNGGGHIAQVCVGILNYLQSEKGSTDWDRYFAANYDSRHGFKSLGEVADHLELYLEWDDRLLGRDMDPDTYMEVSAQVYAQAQEAMYFVADNLAGLWD